MSDINISCLTGDTVTAIEGHSAEFEKTSRPSLKKIHQV